MRTGITSRSCFIRYCQRFPTRWRPIGTLNDLRYALRTLRANRLFAAMAMLSLALGIGANTAIYSFMDAILVRTLPVRDPARWSCCNGTAIPIGGPRWCPVSTGPFGMTRAMAG